MEAKSRMKCEERKAHILGKVREVFAHKGLEGVTTRELARAADVSEGLLFKHFPNKEALYQAMLSAIESETDLPERMENLLSSEPSTRTLVQIVHTLVSELITSQRNEVKDIVRIYLRSLAGDGEFARFALNKPRGHLIPMLERNIKAAAMSGDIQDSPVPLRLRAWFTERLTFMLMVDYLPSVPTIDYGMSRDRLVKHLAWFLLRGVGLREEAIREHYTARALKRSAD
jgi:AcrR family transcriptional regulator